MAGGDPGCQGSRYPHNDAAFVEYHNRLQSNNLATFATAASKFTEWLGSDRAYYPSARVPIVSIIESAHANICRLQEDPSAPFMLDKTSPGLGPWYQPYLALIKQVGSHLNYFEPELRARLQPLVENAGIKVVQVPTPTESTTTQQNPFPPEECDNNCSTPTAKKENSVAVDVLSQVAGPSNQVRPSETIPPATIPEPQRKGRRKLNKAIFDVDTMAALRIKAQPGHQEIEANMSPSHKATVQQKAAVVAQPPAQLSEGPPKAPLVERVPNAENSIGERPQAQSKDDGPLLDVAFSTLSRARTEGLLLSEKVTGGELPRERSPFFLPGVAESANPSPEGVETNNVDEEPPGSPGSRPEANPGPVATEPSTGSSVPAPDLEEVWAEERVRTPKEDVGRDVPPRSPGNITICGTIRRRQSDDTVSKEQCRTSTEPPIKRVRTESEVTTVIAPSPSRAVTPGAATRGPSDSAIPVSTRGIQRSSSDMILGSENEASPPPRRDVRAADKRTDGNSGLSSSGQQPSTESQTETLGAESHGVQVTEETMPPIQDLSLASPTIRPNPFTACRIPFHPRGPLLPSVPPTAIPDVGRFLLHPLALDHTRGGTSTIGPQVQYIFSAAEVRTLVASRGSDECSGPNKLAFYLDWSVLSGVAKWRNFKAGQSPLEGSVCLSLACYPVDSVAGLMSSAKENQPFDVLIRQARIKSSWPSGPTSRSTLKDGSGKSYAIPPFSALQATEDNFIDISESAVPGANTYTIEDHGQSLSNWLFAVYIHTPTIAYFDAIQARVNKEKKWVDVLTSFTRYSLPVVNWDALQPRDTE